MSCFLSSSSEAPKIPAEFCKLMRFCKIVLTHNNITTYLVHCTVGSFYMPQQFSTTRLERVARVCPKTSPLQNTVNQVSRYMHAVSHSFLRIVEFTLSNKLFQLCVSSIQTSVADTVTHQNMECLDKMRSLFCEFSKAWNAVYY